MHPGSLRIDLHTHTSASFDSWNTPQRYTRSVTGAGIDTVAITDHGTIRGALAVRALDPPFGVIVGQEIRAEEGEIIGLFLEEEIPGSLPADVTCDRIHEQGGLVMVPHPYAVFATERLPVPVTLSLMDRIDIVETINGRTTFAFENRRAAALAERFDKPAAAGSDAHMAIDAGRAYQTVRPFDGPADFLDALRDATHVLQRRAFLPVSGLTMVYAFCRRGWWRVAGTGPKRLD